MVYWVNIEGNDMLIRPIERCFQQSNVISFTPGKQSLNMANEKSATQARLIKKARKGRGCHFSQRSRFASADY